MKIQGLDMYCTKQLVIFSPQMALSPFWILKKEAPQVCGTWVSGVLAINTGKLEKSNQYCNTTLLISPRVNLIGRKMTLMCDRMK